MPQDISILNIPGMVIEKMNGINPIHLFARFETKPSCPECKSENLHKKKMFTRKIRHENFGNRPVFLVVKCNQFRCRDCNKYFNTRFPGILKWKRSSEAFRKEVFELHHRGMSQVDLASYLRIGSATVERWYQDFIKRKNQELLSYECPRYLGIDEHFFSKKLGYSTTVCNLSSNKILDIFPAKSEAKLGRYLAQLKHRERVEMVCIDMCQEYRSIIKKYFPNARIVTDRFHVIRLINQAFIKTWQQLHPEAKYSRGLLSLMRRHKWHLKEHQQKKLYAYMDDIPGLRAIYDFKHNLTKLLLIKNQTAREVKKLIPKLIIMVAELKKANFNYLVTLGNTLDKWLEEVVCMWRYSKNNGITEGFHRKMKLIQRRAYGFKNFENYRLRVRALCC
ncbi:ISL3 family transposase [Candidatus Margulisiibacteriota bacterium]